ncbi:MAG: DUF169 domain-containing protein [Dehalococcoidales bacterium]|nr:DUF169 domain-containing protein [Dehalococcoidales bacterium]
MAAKKPDYSVLDRFNFERKPVGVLFTSIRPKGIKRIAKELNFCEMLKEAQAGNSFYVAPTDWVCVGIEQMILGMAEPDPVLISGALGGEDKLFKCASACRALYNYIPYMPKNSVKYVVFATVDKMTFDPDLLVITAELPQARTILRSVNFSTGEPFVSKATPVVACAWIYVYPVVNGELNYYITGLGQGMNQLNIFPPGLFLISIPFQKIPMVLENLPEMEYTPQMKPGPGGPAHRKRVNKLLADLRKKIKE